MATALGSVDGVKTRAISFLLLLSITAMVPTVQADSEVFDIKVDGEAVDCATGFSIKEPNQAKENKKICIGHTMLSGTMIETPANTELKYRNRDATGNEVTLGPNSANTLVTSDKAESYRSIAGKIWFNVKNRLSFFSVSSPDRTIQAAVEGTVFETEVDGNSIRYKILEGAVNISQEFKIEIDRASNPGANTGDDTEKRRKRDLFTHKFEQLTSNTSEAVYPLDYYEKQPERFGSIAAANQHFTELLDSQDRKVDSETLANLNATIGRICLAGNRPQEAQELFMKALAMNERLSPDGIDPFLVDNHMDIAFALQALDQHEQAIKHFKIAYEIQMLIDPWDPLVAELLLDLSDVYSEVNNTVESHARAQQAIRVLEETTRQDLEDYNHSIAECEIETAQVIAASTADAYESMAFAQQNLGDEAAADRFFERSENIINRANTGEYFDCAKSPLPPSIGAGQDYLGDTVRISIGYDSETDLTGEFFWNFHENPVSAYSFEGWKGVDSSGGLKFNAHWLAEGHVRKVFMAADRNVFRDGKLTIGGGGEFRDRFWSVYASKSTTGERFLGSSAATEQQVTTGTTIDSHDWIQTDTWITTTEFFAHPYDWGVGFRVGTYIEDMLLRLRGGLDYETGDYSSSQATAFLGLEKRFPGSGHGLSLRAEYLHKKGDFETDKNDVRFSAYWSWSFGTVFRTSYRMPEECIDFTLPPEGGYSCATADRVDATTGAESAWIRRALRNPVTHKRSVDYYRYNRSTEQHDTVVDVINDGPLAVDDSYTVDRDSKDNVLSVLENDSDPENDYLNIVGVSNPTHGTAVISGDSTVLYTPDEGFTGEDTFTYEIEEMHLMTPHPSGPNSTATVTINVTNDPPVAVDDEYEVMKNSQNSFDVLVNDFDPDGDALSIVSATPPMHGQVAVGPANIEYAPTTGYCGTDSFTYTITDGKEQDTASVMITVVNRLPVAVDDSASTKKGTPVVINVLANDSDPDGDPLTIVDIIPSDHPTGTFEDNGDGTVTYSPTPGWWGGDSFQYTISDDCGGMSTATVTLHVRS